MGLLESDDVTHAHGCDWDGHSGLRPRFLEPHGTLCNRRVRFRTVRYKSEYSLESGAT
jgi:hypothetical protein